MSRHLSLSNVRASASFVIALANRPPTPHPSPPYKDLGTHCL